jgi:putative hemolysin
LDPGSLFSLALIPICLLVLALDVAAETAMANISRLRLHQLLDRGMSRARTLSALLNDSRLHTVLRAANLAVAVLLAALLVGVLAPLRLDLPAVSGLVIVMTLFAVMLGLLAPQAIAVRHPERVALLLIPYLTAVRTIVGPLLAFLYWLARPIARLLDSGHETGHYLTAEEMRELGDSEEPATDESAEEQEMIQQIFEFGDTVAREVMVPRTDMVTAEDTEVIPAVVDRILDCGHTRLPVYHETIDNIVGIVNAKDLLRALRQGQPERPLVEFVRPAHFIPETKKVADLLRDLRSHRLPMAIVVDEYGGTAGLVTIEDLVEEIVGEIQDEYDVEPALLEELSPTEWRCDARLPLDDLNDLLGTQLEGADVETVGGLVQERLGRIPAVGDSITEGDIVITVLSTEGLRIKQLNIRRGGEPSGESDPVPPPTATVRTESPVPPAH